MFGGDVDKAIESFRTSTQIDPKSDETYVRLAIALRKKGDTAGAEQALQEALRLNPRSAFAKSTAERRWTL
jgi:eukaryotic-like serine/threonine-protein kinase